MVEELKYWIYVAYDNHDTPNRKAGFLLKMEGDTTIANQNYKKVIRQGLEGSHPCPPAAQPCFEFNLPYKTISSQVIGYAREDLNTKTSYFLPISSQYCDTSEFQLFDFSVDAGDTLDYCARIAIGGETNPDYGIIDSITNTIVYNKTRRTLNTLGYVTYIGLPFESEINISEGVGFLNFGLFFIDHGLSELVNFCEGTLADCNIISPTTNETTGKTFQIYPNPSTSQITLNTTEEIEQVQLLSSNGSIVLSKIQSPVLHIAAIPAGVYFLVVQFQNGYIKVEKVIKI